MQAQWHRAAFCCEISFADADNSDSAMEYERHTDSYFDPFAELYNVTAPAGA
jgi:hypothetical protein